MFTRHINNLIIWLEEQVGAPGEPSPEAIRRSETRESPAIVSADTPEYLESIGASKDMVREAKRAIRSNPV